MATKSENSEIAVLQTQMEQVIRSVGQLDKKLDKFAENYVTRSEHNKDVTELSAEHEKDVIELTGEVEKAKRKTAFQTAITGVLSAALGVVLTILIQSYIGSH